MLPSGKAGGGRWWPAHNQVERLQQGQKKTKQNLDSAEFEEGQGLNLMR